MDSGGPSSADFIRSALVANSALTKTRQVDKSSNKAAMHKSTPVKTSVGGQSYVRTKSGNLLSVDLVKRRDLEAKNKRLNKLVETVKGVQKARRLVFNHRFLQAIDV